jgi:hemerythrin
MAPNARRVVPILGDEMIDLFHGKLGSLLFDARDLAQQGDTRGLIRKILEFRAITADHFKVEEVILRGVDFAGFDDHHAQHNHYIASIEDSLSGIGASDRPADRFELLELIERVMFEHEVVEDSTFMEDLSRFHERPFLWHPRLAVGIPRIDEQHQNLMAMLADIRRYELHGASPSSLRAALDAFLDLAHQHFTEEMDFIETAGGRSSQHRVEHERMARDLEQRLAQCGAERPGRLIANFLGLWLLDHIVTADQPDLAPFATPSPP